MPLQFIICHQANQKLTHNHITLLITYAHSSSCNTIGQCLLFNLSHTAVTLVLYAVDKGLRVRIILQSVVIDSATYLLTLTLLNLPNIDNIAMSLYDITTTIIHR